MPAPANTHLTVDTVGIREDLEGSIYRVAPEETPFMGNIGKKSIDGTLHEWQTEVLATPDPDNASIEGKTTVIEAAHKTKRIGVYAQIFDKSGSVSRTNRKADRAGRDDALDEQKMIKGIEIRRDMEARFIGNYASQAEDGPNDVPRKTAGALAYIDEHESKGIGATTGGWQSGGLVSAAVDGTARGFTEAQVKAVLAQAFSNGARMSTCYLGPSHKQEFSAFSGIAEVRVNETKAKKTKIIAAADVYVSDFGNISMIPHPYGLSQDALFVDPSGWEVGTYDGMHSYDLAKTGDSDSFLAVCEKALICKNPRKGAVIRDLLTA